VGLQNIEDLVRHQYNAILDAEISKATVIDHSVRKCARVCVLVCVCVCVCVWCGVCVCVCVLSHVHMCESVHLCVSAGVLCQYYFIRDMFSERPLRSADFS
jgi:choline-glycine betaine transporter